MKRRATDKDTGDIYLVRGTGRGYSLPGLFAESDNKGAPPRLISCDLEGSLFFANEFTDDTNCITLGFEFIGWQAQGLDVIVVDSVRYIDSAWQRKFYGRQLEQERKKFKKAGIELPQLKY